MKMFHSLHTVWFLLLIGKLLFFKWLTKPCTTKILWNNILKHSAAKFAPFFSPKNEAYSFSDWLSWCRDNYKPLKTSLSESSYFYWQPAMPLYTHTQRHTEVVWPGIDAVEVCFFFVCVCRRQLELPMQLFLSRGQSLLERADYM